ncbi:MAG TPA: hypothetical protein VHU84_17820 [Lacipirellulaceae bacterium]|jgi:hypothetical protein|nr:hypothetical protein [Lacipirellulaceae bacterium]
MTVALALVPKANAPIMKSEAAILVIGSRNMTGNVKAAEFILHTIVQSEYHSQGDPARFGLTRLLAKE